MRRGKRGELLERRRGFIEQFLRNTAEILGNVGKQFDLTDLPLIMTAMMICACGCCVW